MFRPFAKLSARLQWAYIVAGLAIMLLAAEALFIRYVFQDGLNDSVARSRDLSRTVAAKLEVIITDDRLVLEKVAALPSVRDYLNQGCDPAFHAFNEFSAQQFERIFLMTPEGRIACEPADVAPGRENSIREYDWFKNGFASDGFEVNRLFKTYPNGRMIIPLTHPVKDTDGKTIGLLVLSLDLEAARARVFQWLPDIKGLRAVVLDEHDQYLLHTDASVIGERPEITPDQYITLSDTTARIQGIDSTWRLVGVSPVAGTKWRAYVGVPEDIALADARETAIMAAATGIAVMLLFAVPFVWFGWVSVKRNESTQQQVAELTELHEFLWANIPEGAAFFNEQGLILDANQQLVGMLGRARNEIIGRKLNDFTVDERAIEREKLRQDGFSHWTTAFKRADGSIIEIETKLQSFAADDRKLYVGVFRDFTELRGAEERLRRNEELLAQTELVAAIGGWEYDVVNNTARWTAQTKRIHEVPDDFQVSRTAALTFFAPESHPILSAAFQKCLMQGEPYDLNLPFTTARGRKLWVRTLGRAVQENGKTVRIIGTLQDVTAQKMAELALEDARAKAEVASKAKSSFIAVMSHEIRTPLTGILGMADLLLTEQLTPHQKALVDRLLRSGRVLLDLINDVLDFSKIEANKLTLDCTVFSPAEIFRSVQELLEPIAAERGIRLVFDTSDTLAQTVMGDPKRLRQVLVNLIGNALKFTERGAVSVSADCYPGENGDHVLHVSVVDTGIGISEADQQNLFKPYVQAESGASARSLGTGLGLSICKLLVEAMGGEITVFSSAGQGSTFTFSVRLQPDRPLNAEAQRGPAKTAGPATPLRILVAEDNETSRYLVQNMLARKGHSVVTVENGAQALETVQRQSFDIVLMDMQMPVMDGKDAVRAIRKLGGAYAALPIIALTADMVDENRGTYFDAGVDALVGKPVDWAALDTEMIRLMAPPRGPVTSASPTAAPATANDIDYAAIAMIADLLGVEKFEKLLTSFRENMLKYQADIHQHIADNDLRLARRTAHSIKGLALQFGATTVGQMAARMEADAMGVAEITAQLQLFDQKIAEALEALSKPGLAQQLIAATSPP